MNHLTDDQLAGWLAGEADQQTHEHLESCPQCRTEALELRDGISRYSVAMRRQAARARRAQMPGNFAPRRALAMHRMRWAAAGVLVLVLAAQTAWLLKSRPAARPAASVAVASRPATQSATQSATQLSDDELLEAVNNDLSREVPLALAPVSAITTARNRMAAASSVAAITDVR